MAWADWGSAAGKGGASVGLEPTLRPAPFSGGSAPETGFSLSCGDHASARTEDFVLSEWTLPQPSGVLGTHTCCPRHCVSGSDTLPL